MKIYEKYNLHSHTYRCNHASGDVPELIEAARTAGYTTLGISEHTVLSDDRWAHMRLAWEEMEGYFLIIEKYKEIEKNKADGIRLLSGLECEPIEEYFDFYREIREKYKINFFIEGNHVIPYEGQDIWAGDKFDTNRKLKAYGDHMIKGIQSGLFVYVAHPDMIMSGKERWDKYIEGVMTEVIYASKQYDIPLEINLNGYRKGLARYGLNLRYPYPLEQFWELVSREGAPAVIGVDAHSPRNFHAEYPDFDKMLERLNLNILNEKEILKRINYYRE